MMTRPLLLDMYACAGGAAMGYSRAGFDVIGVDIQRRKSYPFECIEADVLTLDPKWIADNFDAVHASPPCQAHTALKTMHNAKVHSDLIEPTRRLLNATGLPWIMENVVGAPLIDPVVLCGTMFGLGTGDAELRRHRLFETNFSIPLTPQCHHRKPRVIGVYGGHGRDRRRTHNTQDFSVAQRAEAMGINWMTGVELSQAIPPAYTEHLGRQMLAHMQWQAVA